MLAAAIAVILFMVGTNRFGDVTSRVTTPCSDPLTFRVGDIDERFLITDDELAGLIQDVAEIWSDAADTMVVVYDENGDIAVNLVYAEVQQLSDREKQHRGRLEHEEFSITVLGNEYQRMNREYEAEVARYEEDSRNLQLRIDRMNEWVVQKNNEGGFNEQDLDQYENRKKEIDRVKRELARREITLEQRADELNEKIDFLNDKIERKNKLVDDYNRMFTGVRKFTQGAYEWTADSRSINIFHFIGRDELRLVLAHEIGHALGINHVQNPRSVMYELMGSQARPGIELTDEDIQALQNICQPLSKSISN